MLRDADAAYARTVGRSHRLRVKVDAWLADELLVEDVPLVGGSLAEAGDQAVAETLTLRVPQTDKLGRSWRPTSHLSPLSSHGQRLNVTHNVIRGDGSALTIGLGWFDIQDWDLDSGAVAVTAVGLTQSLVDYGLLTSTSPPAVATFATEIPRLVDGSLPVLIDPALVDRAVPANMAWQDDRIGAITELLTAWPARMFVDEQGVLNVTTPYLDTEAAELTLLELKGTVVSSSDGGSRQGLPSAIIAKGEDATSADRSPIVAYAVDTNPASPTFVGRYRIKTETFASPLLTTVAQAQKAANTRLASSARQARVIPVTTVPDARIRPGVRVDFQRAERVNGRRVLTTLVRCRVLTTELQLTADGGAQRLDLGVIP